jgi:hypothetical protein
MRQRRGPVNRLPQASRNRRGDVDRVPKVVKKFLTFMLLSRFGGMVAGCSFIGET